MDKTTSAIKAQAIKLSPAAHLELVDAILGSLDKPDKNIDSLWSQETEERLSAYSRGDLKSIPMYEVLAKYSIQ
jgi:hypothetical protein